MNSYEILKTIDSPADMRKLPKEKLPQLAREVRDWMLETVGDTGGHLGAGLGVTDLTIALHYVLNTPEDFLVFDVGHQVQAHKIITGRRDAFRKTFRQYKGISGLANASEGPYDPFTTGHGGPSISSALGVATAAKLRGKTKNVVAVIGDTSIASGMALEALNHAGHIRENLTVILNDNEMSISPSVGALSKYFNRVISNPTYNHLRDDVEKLVNKIPRVGKHLLKKIRQIEESAKHLLVPGQLFEDLGFRYFGPLDGHQLVDMVEVLPNILKLPGPKLIHIITQKGKGYHLAEADPVKWHASTPFDVNTGELKKKSSSAVAYTKVYGNTLCAVAKENEKVVALTGGMPAGTGLTDFAKQFPDRFFDVGISEEHGVTFCAGLAYSGMRPACTVYSTFLQRGFDQIAHDISLQNIPVMLFMDRAGLVGEDGPTHHGAFDMAYLRLLPRMTMMAPRDGKELELMVRFATDFTTGPISCRYPRGAIAEETTPQIKDFAHTEIKLGKAELLKEGSDVLLLPIGSMVANAIEAAEILEAKGISTSIINARFIKPLDQEMISRWVGQTKVTLTLEEGCLNGGFGSAVLESLSKGAEYSAKVQCLGIPDEFIEHGPRDILLDNISLSPQKIAEHAIAVLASIDTDSKRLKEASSKPQIKTPIS
ncbi:MAG: 1-deoxy-D-xylulose-5-phosphate synthase [Candidatus Omnitrophota bacterium]|jgi:1-deoxy-D-xylulose-5-phosphate synthase